MRVLVTGGGGFLGSAIVRRLSARGDQVSVLGRGEYPSLRGVAQKAIRADVRDGRAVREACRGMEAVIHTASIPRLWGPRREFESINIDGTRNVIEGCVQCGVGRLVYTSTPSVVFGEKELCGVDESIAYPARYLAAYPRTKAIAEQMVLSANGGRLATVALRPHLIWGPGDPHLFPRILARAKAGRLVQVGEGDNLVDTTYIDNAALAHVLALDRVAPGAACAGRAYFISQGSPIQLWPWLNKILSALSIPGVSRTMSFRRAWRVGGLLEGVYRLFGIGGEPVMTRFLAGQLAKSHYFNIAASQRDLGYVPEISTAAGEERLISWLKTLS